jgi:hypothetical protein
VRETSSSDSLRKLAGDNNIATLADTDLFVGLLSGEISYYGSAASPRGAYLQRLFEEYLSGVNERQLQVTVDEVAQVSLRASDVTAVEFDSQPMHVPVSQVNAVLRDVLDVTASAPKLTVSVGTAWGKVTGSYNVWDFAPPYALVRETPHHYFEMAAASKRLAERRGGIGDVFNCTVPGLSLSQALAAVIPPSEERARRSVRITDSRNQLLSASVTATEGKIDGQVSLRARICPTDLLTAPRCFTLMTGNTDPDLPYCRWCPIEGRDIESLALYEMIERSGRMVAKFVCPVGLSSEQANGFGTALWTGLIVGLGDISFSAQSSLLVSAHLPISRDVLRRYRQADHMEKADWAIASGIDAEVLAVNGMGGVRKPTFNGYVTSPQGYIPGGVLNEASPIDVIISKTTLTHAVQAFQNIHLRGYASGPCVVACPKWVPYNSN